MTFRTKLILAQLPLVLAMIVTGFFCLDSFSTLGRRSQEMMTENYKSVLAAQGMKDAVERMDRGALMKLAGQGDPAKHPSAEHRRRFESHLEIQEANITEPGEKEATVDLRARWERYRTAYETWETEPNLGKARASYLSELAPAFLAVKDGADTILAINQDAMVLKSDRAQELGRRLSRLALFIFAGTLVLAGVLSVYLTHRALGPLSRLAQAARRIAEGDLEMRVKIDGKDEVSQLAGEFNAMAEKLNEYRKTSLGELLKAQLEMQASIDSIPDPILFVGPEGDVTNCNRAASQILGLDPDLPSAEMWSRLPESIREVVERLTKQVHQGKGAQVPRGFDESVRAALPDGDRYFLPRATPLYGQRGEVTGSTVMLQDVTRLRRFDELRNDIVATVAHEFRTPLTSLQMAIHLCLDQKVGPLSTKQADLLTAAREDCGRLRGLVDDLLDLSRLHTGRVEMQKRPASVKDLIDGVIAQHRVAAEERSIRLAAEPVPPDLEGLLDPTRISLVLSNLIGNALRHTAEGGQVVVRARPSDRTLRFEVADTGEGIAPEYRDRIFDKFFQVPGAKVGGSGLGLTIAKEIVKAHEGQIGVESEVGKGSTFWFTLPAPPGASS
ncbi:MAG TPA: ATP-binding protein [Planctomycetota bacterium]|nr:ATP-binding protein [Planctomycetota bacterium]